MDYCYPCRRHLNGAHACPGCGTPVEDIRAAAEAHADDERVSVTGDPDEGWEDRDDTSDHSPSRKGRRASHRRKRRRVLLVVGGLVLATGALSLGKVSIEVPFKSHDSAAATQGADGHDATPSGEPTTPQDTASGTPSSVDPATSASPADATGSGATENAEDAADAAGKGRGGDTGTDGRDGDTKQPAPGEPPGTSTGAPQPGGTGGAGDTGGSDGSGGSRNPPPPDSDPHPSDPDPSPSRSCTWIIVWWCS